MSSADEKPQDSLSEDSKEVKGNANEAEEEEVLGFDEVMDSINNMIETSEVLLGGENDKVCSYPEGYKPRQALFACLTCRNETGKSAGVCFGCSVNCHDGHQIVELYSKRKFKCDCGNSKFNTKCKLYEEKDAVNEYNTYNDNYEGNFCLCKKPYTPEDCTEDMVQCELCEDWFHLTHLNMTAEEIKNMEETEETTSLVCGSCTKTNPFLTLLNKSEDVVCLSSGVVDGEIDDKRGIYINNLRKKLCKCAGCEKLYDRQAIEYLIDPEDEIAKFEQDNKEKAAASKPTEQEEFNALVGELGRDGAVMVLQGINNLKRKLADWAKEKKGEVIKSGDVTEFFDRLNEEQAEKRARMFE